MALSTLSTISCLVLLAFWPRLLLSQNHCAFNQGQQGRDETTTVTTYHGQFGSFTSSTPDDLASTQSSVFNVTGLGHGLPPYSAQRQQQAIVQQRMYHEVREISCIGVPFARVPDFPAPSASHVDVVHAGLSSLESDVLPSVQGLESARFMHNQISHIDQDAFRALYSTTLKSLDLSYNSLSEIPLAALARLKGLDWLNLHSNDIYRLTTANHISYNSLKNSLSTLFLSRNALEEIHSSFFRGFRQLHWLNMDDNKVRDVHPDGLPTTLLTLSLAQNLISKFPFEAVRALVNLKWLNLRGNYIEGLPREAFPQRRYLEKLDLGENFLTSVPGTSFEASLEVADLHLDHNYIEVLEEAAFAGLRPRRLYLGMNRIFEIQPLAFQGGINRPLELELLDLERNRLTNVSWALTELKTLRYLYLNENQISTLPPELFSKFCRHLRALGLAKNQLPAFPTNALGHCAELSHLNLGYNEIREINSAFFGEWSKKLETLILSGNRLTTLPPRVFKNTPRLRELALSFNSFESLDSEAFRDVGTVLESLEISFGLKSSIFPEAALKPLQKLLWLSLDNNVLEHISETALYSLGELQYLNLESNRFTSLPHNLLHKNVHKNLLDIRLSYNRLRVIRSGTFSALARAQSISLSGNEISIIEPDAFRHMPTLDTLILTSNQIERVGVRAFLHLDNLRSLELQHNKLTEFSLNAFENCTRFPMYPMKLNVSHNLIRHLTPASHLRIPFIEEVDASRNSMRRIPKAFLEFLNHSLRKIDLSFNFISSIEKVSFRHLSLLQVLNLSHNNLIELAKSAFHSLTSLQMLDLSWNKIEVLQFGQFAGLGGLRTVNLAHNQLRSLPRDVFQATSIEHVDLSYNHFVALPTSALTETSATIRSLNLSHNRIEHIDSTMFANTPHLVTLSLAHNRLTILPDNIFIGLGSLLTLEMSSNPIRANFKELFHYVPHLRHLKLAEVDLDTLPVLPLPQLTALDLSGNLLQDLPGQDLMLGSLRQLNISRNQFTHLPAHFWHFLPYLRHLDISRNPLRVLTKESFSGLHRLQQLHVQHLGELSRFDADSLAHLTFLHTLYIQSWPSIEKFKFRLGSVVSGLASLKHLSARILEPQGVLTDQILGAFGPKLRRLELTGPLKRVTLDAFEGIESYELVVIIRDTQLQSLPDGFLTMFSNVAHMSLDLRNNLLNELNPEALYKNVSQWEKIGTGILQGGLALQGNPFPCSCENIWMGKWLRRWMRETLQLHSSVPERAQKLQGIVRTITCFDPENPLHTKPLVSLDEAVRCYEDKRNKLTNGSPRRLEFLSFWIPFWTSLLTWIVSPS